MTVIHNGVTAIDHKEIEGITGGALDANEGEAGPFYIQGDHTGRPEIPQHHGVSSENVNGGKQDQEQRQDGQIGDQAGLVLLKVSGWTGACVSA